ncbi:MAG: histidine--tRNA ligase [Alphaproteobacteria bacterium]
MDKLQKIKGTQDLLQSEMKSHRFVIETARRVASNFGYDSIATPIFESTDVFSRPLGETSDVVTKEMYTFESRGGDSITLRPEGTAGVVRSFIENGLTQSGPFKVFYDGAMFRYERPQKGRQRQFHQFGVEALSVENSTCDVEIIAMGQMILEQLGVAKDITLHINTLGDKESRDNYRDKLVSYLSDFKNELSEDSKSRLEKNPLRILDSKDENDRKIIKDAPVLYDSLNEVSKTHFDNVLAGLDSLGIKYVHDHNLVRGFDYYCHTAFEFITDTLGAQGTVLGGGRYDNLCELMGGNKTAGIGFAAGVERLALMVGETNFETNDSVCIIPMDDNSTKQGLIIASDLRGNNIRAEMTFSGNMKKRMKYADKIGAKIAVIIGEEEMEKQSATVRDLVSGEQTEVPFNDITTTITNILKG